MEANARDGTEFHQYGESAKNDVTYGRWGRSQVLTTPANRGDLICGLVFLRLRLLLLLLLLLLVKPG